MNVGSAPSKVVTASVVGTGTRFRPGCPTPALRRNAGDPVAQDVVAQRADELHVTAQPGGADRHVQGCAADRLTVDQLAVHVRLEQVDERLAEHHRVPHADPLP